MQKPEARRCDPDFRLLAPGIVNQSEKQTKYVIDPHCHVYNATDWLVGGALRGPLANEYDPPVCEILRELANPVERITRKLSLTAAEELKLLSCWDCLPADQAQDELDTHRREHRESLALELARALFGSKLARLVTEALQDGTRLFTGEQHRQFDADFLLAAFQQPLTLEEAGQVRSTEKTRWFDKVRGLFVFLRHIMSPRYDNLLSYRSHFSTGGKRLGVDCCLAAMLDFDYWIGDDDHPPSRLRDQVELMAKMSKMSGGFMRPIVAYNPWTDIKDDDESLELVRWAVEEKGCVGVKIYPPMGYYPNRNRQQPYPGGGNAPNLCKLDKKLEEKFWPLCRSLKVPVMTHSEQSIGQTKKHKELGGPKAWTTFFHTPGNEGTKINLAHMGGELGGGRGPQGWTRDFATLMGCPAAENLYGDFGLWDELVDEDGEFREESVKRIVSLLDEPVSNDQTVADRFMFGTDWFMLTFTHPAPDYAELFQRALVQAGVKQDILDKIFFRNAAHLFDIECPKAPAGSAGTTA